MTERKPPGLSWESWIDKQIREAEERGAFANLPGAGQPIPDLDRPFDELWWVKAKLRREGLSYMPPSVALRKEAHDALEAASRAKSEAEVRQLITDINQKIRDANRTGIPGPSLMLMPFDADQVVRDWRTEHSQEEPPAAETRPDVE
jgi:DnaJ homologue, subfamily C, member 28, conserved domain